MKHDFYLNEQDLIDIWRLDVDYHNGPECRRCKMVFCQHCTPECFEEECPSGQLELL